MSRYTAVGILALYKLRAAILAGGGMGGLIFDLHTLESVTAKG